MSNEATNGLTIHAKYTYYVETSHNILPTIASFFMSDAGKIVGVPEFKIKVFE